VTTPNLGQDRVRLPRHGPPCFLADTRCKSISQTCGGIEKPAIRSGTFSSVHAGWISRAPEEGSALARRKAPDTASRMGVAGIAGIAGGGGKNSAS
jgi:hypothetical protein